VHGDKENNPAYFPKNLNDFPQIAIRLFKISRFTAVQTELYRPLRAAFKIWITA
jgi:hypothetical protein